MLYRELVVLSGEQADKWWKNPATGEPVDRDKGEILMLFVSELAEGMEGARKDLMDDHLPAHPMLHVELADAFIRAADLLYRQFSWPSADLETVFSRAASLVSKSFLEIDAEPKIGGQLLVLTSAVLDIRAAFRSDARARESGLWIKPEAPRRIAHFMLMTNHLAGRLGFSLDSVVREKLAYNETRADHKNEARLAPGGKKW